MAAKTIDQMRSLIRSAYPHTKWQTRVDKMSNDQVYAVYMRLLRSGAIRTN